MPGLDINYVTNKRGESLKSETWQYFRAWVDRAYVGFAKSEAVTASQRGFRDKREGRAIFPITRNPRAPERKRARKETKHTSNRLRHARAWNTEGRKSHPRPRFDSSPVAPMLLHNARTRSKERRDSGSLPPRQTECTTSLMGDGTNRQTLAVLGKANKCAKQTKKKYEMTNRIRCFVLRFYTNLRFRQTANEDKKAAKHRETEENVGGGGNGHPLLARRFPPRLR